MSTRCRATSPPTSPRLLAATETPLLALGATLERTDLNGQPGALVRDRASGDAPRAFPRDGGR
jgi:hypothetical protein